MTRQAQGETDPDKKCKTGGAQEEEADANDKGKLKSDKMTKLSSSEMRTG